MLIKLENIVKNYYIAETTFCALDNVSLDISEGEMIAVIGASGSGKSTMMNILGCLDKIDSGNYFLSGENISNKNSNELAKIRNEMIGFVFQNFNLLPRMTAIENVELPMYYSGKTDTYDNAYNALKIVGLENRINHQPNQLSGGQKQRVAIARAIVNNPHIILADEPTGALDSKTSVEIMDLFQKLNSEGRTIIIVTHEHDIADYCQKKILMKDGKIIEISEK